MSRRWDGDARSARAADRGLAAGRSGASTGRRRDQAQARAGTPIGAIRAMPACRRSSISGSQNVKQVEVLWPAPRAHAPKPAASRSAIERRDLSAAGHAAGRRQAGVLRLKLDYAICEKLCVPAEGRRRAGVARAARASQDARARGRRGARAEEVALGRGRRPVDPLGAARGRPGRAAGRGRCGGARGRRDLFAEGRRRNGPCRCRADRRRTAPAAALRLRARRRCRRGDYQGALLTLTAVTPGRAIEVATRLD